MKLNKLENGQKVNARFARYRDDTEGPDWGAWQEITLHVQHNIRGEILIITPKDLAWAEYRPSDFSPVYKSFESEGYQMEIQGLEA